MSAQVPLYRRAAGWARHLARIAAGRPAWSAEREFAYYRVAPEQVRGHREGQDTLEREAFLRGLLIARALGLLDAGAERPGRVLDLGAGECALSGALAGPLAAREVWAVDAVPKQIWAAAERRRPRLRCLIADARNLPFSDGSFDLVVANLVLHHIEPVDAVLAEARRLLRPGGRFAALEPSPLVGVLSHAETSENEAPIRPGAVTAALRRHGFVDVRQKYVWTRLNTSALGPLSPSYRVVAAAPGSLRGAALEAGDVPLVRELETMRLPGLLIDPGCPFHDAARAQEAELLALRALLERPAPR
jgi:SAM-dependent methyltransferase